MTTEQQSKPAGWYSNPTEPTQSLRYWNGAQWTHNTLARTASDVPVTRSVQVENDESQTRTDGEVGQEELPGDPSSDPPTRIAISATKSRAKTAQRVGDVFTFFALITLILGVGGGVIFGIWALNEMSSATTPETVTDDEFFASFLIVLGSLLQYAFLRLGSVVSFYVEDRYRGIIP